MRALTGDLFGLYSPLAGGEGTAMASYEAVVAEDGSGDYTTMQEAWDAGVRRIGLKGPYRESVGGFIVVDNSADITLHTTFPKIGVYGVDEDAEIIFDVDSNTDVLSHTTQPTKTNSGHQGIPNVTSTVSTFGDDNIPCTVITAQDATDFEAIGVEVGMRFGWNVEGEGYNRHGSFPAKVLAVSGGTVTVERQYHTVTAQNIDYEACWFMENGVEFMNLKLKSETSFTKSLNALKGYGQMRNIYSNLVIGEQIEGRIHLTYGAGRHWRCRVDSVHNLPGWNEQSRLHIDAGNYGIVTNCTHFQQYYTPGNFKATWIGCIMRSDYLNDTDGNGMLINCQLLDKTNTSPNTNGAFKYFNCCNAHGEDIEDNITPEGKRVWVASEITGTIAPTQGGANYFNASTGTRTFVLDRPAGAVSGDEKITDVTLSVLGSNVTPGSLTVTFTGSQFYSPTGQKTTITITGSTAVANEPIQVTLRQYENSHWYVLSESINTGGDGSIVYS